MQRTRFKNFISINFDNLQVRSEFTPLTGLTHESVLALEDIALLSTVYFYIVGSHTVWLIVSFCILAFGLYKRSYSNDRVCVAILFFNGAVLLNWLVIGFLSSGTPRYTLRLEWLIVLSAFYALHFTTRKSVAVSGLSE